MAEREYEKVLVAVDPVILTISEGKLKVLLSLREKEPFKGKYELLGGILKEGETAEETLQRKLREVLGTEAFFTQFAAFTNPKRDPRARTISIGYLTLISDDRAKTTHRWFNVENLPQLAFDHGEIIANAQDYLKENLSSGVMKHFLPVYYPLNKLQEVHEIIMGEKYDNRNFRKKMIASGIVKETNKKENEVSHRPAKLYRFVQ